MSPRRIISALLLPVLLSTCCAQWDREKASPGPGRMIPANLFLQEHPNVLAIQGYAPGWVMLTLGKTDGDEPAEIVLRAGSVLRSTTQPEHALLTLSSARVNSDASTKPVLIPVAALFGSRGTNEGQKVGRKIFRSSFKPEGGLVRAELVELANYVSLKNRPWKPTRPEALVMPCCADFLDSAKLRDKNNWHTARDFFAERTPIQVAIWMLLFNVSSNDLSTLLVAYDEDYNLLKGPQKKEALEVVIRDALNLWSAMGYNPEEARLAREYPDLLNAARVTARKEEFGQSFPGSDSPLAPVIESEMDEILTAHKDCLVGRTQYLF